MVSARNRVGQYGVLLPVGSVSVSAAVVGVGGGGRTHAGNVTGADGDATRSPCWYQNQVSPVPGSVEASSVPEDASATGPGIAQPPRTPEEDQPDHEDQPAPPAGARRPAALLAVTGAAAGAGRAETHAGPSSVHRSAERFPGRPNAR